MKLRMGLLVAAFIAPIAGWLAVSAAPVPLPAVDSGLAIIPEKAVIVLQVRGVERTKDRLNAMLKSALPDLAPLAAGQIDQGLAQILDGRKLNGLAKDGPHFVTFLEFPAPEPEAFAIVARITNYAEFRDGLLTADEKTGLKREGDKAERTEIKGQDVYFLDRGGWAIVTPSKDVLATFSKKYDGLDRRLPADVARRISENDISLYVDLAAVNQKFGDQIKEGKIQFFALMDQFGGQDKATMEMGKKVYEGMFQVIEDGKAAVLAFDFRPEGLSLAGTFQIAADTKSNDFLKDQKSATLADVNTMPAGQAVYSATEFAPSMFKAMAPMMYGWIAEGDGRKAVEAAIEALVAAENTNTVSAGNFPASTFQVQTFKDPAKAVKAQLDLFKALGEGAVFQNNSIKDKPEIKENAEEHAGFRFHYVKLTWDLDKLANQIPGVAGDDIKKAMLKILGEGLNVWFGTDGRKVITVNGKDWADARAQVESYLGGKKSIGNEPAFAATRKQLSAETSGLVLFDAGKVAFVGSDYMLAIFKAIPGLPFNLPDSMKPVETKPSFVGLSFSMRPEFGAFEFYLPVAAVQEIRKVVMPLFLGGE